MQAQRLRRSLLYTPGSDGRKIEKAVGLDSDGIIFDLEDAVSPDQKPAARATVAAFLRDRARDGKKEMLVRVNQVSTEPGILDLLAVVPAMPDTLVIPKACPRDIVAADVIISGIEVSLGMAPDSVGVIPLIETAEGVETLAEVIRSASRITGVQLGAEDLTKELGVTRTRQGAEIVYVRNRLALAARAAGIDAIDTPFADYKDEEGLKADIAYCRSIGMTAKTAIHPGQIRHINAAFTPTDAEVAEAKAIVEAYREAVAKGLGACSLNGKMIDVPIAERAQKILDKAARINS
ncbi:MAG: CoA ester lyase [Deltaproteobacteria bacterium]|nr:CoA ester lyase [Deltaproteobacteria bacterium]